MSATSTKTTKAPKVPAKRGPKSPMTDDHKKALAEGREHARIVGNYLAAVNKPKRKRGRQVTVESLTSQLCRAQDALAEASPLEALNLRQQIKDYQKRIAEMQVVTPVDIEKLEADFIRVAGPYAHKHGIERATFIDSGVEKRVLVAAGI